MDTHGHMYWSPQPKSFEELSEWLQQSTFSLSTVWDVLNSHQVAMDNLHAAQLELNKTIEETHCLQSSQSALLQVLEAEFEHFITDHWRPMQAIVQHTRVHLPCTCPLHLAAQRPPSSSSSSGCPLPHRRSGPGSDSGPDVFVTASENGSRSPSSIPPLVSHSPSVSDSPSPIPTLFRGRPAFIRPYSTRPAMCQDMLFFSFFLYFDQFCALSLDLSPFTSLTISL